MKYPIYNRFAYLILAFTDCLLKMLPKKKEHIPLAVRKVLLCNTAHLGDVILTTALLPVLRQAFPDAKIGMLVGSWSKPVVENHPLVDRVYLMDHWKLNRQRISWWAKVWRYLRMRRKVRRGLKEYDLAIDCCFHFPNMAPLLWSAKIPVRIGFSSAGFGPLLTHSYPWDPKENKPAIEAYFSLLQSLQVKRGNLRPNLAVAAKEKKNFVVIHMGSGNKQKNWPKEKWRALVKRLTDDQMELKFTGTGHEENSALEEVIRYFPQAKNLCDQLSFKEFIEVIQQARLLIGVDSCASHIAAAVDTPAVLLYTGIHPHKIWSPASDKIRLVTFPVLCSPCFKGCTGMHCVRSISVEDVYHAVKMFIKP